MRTTWIERSITIAIATSVWAGLDGLFGTATPLWAMAATYAALAAVLVLLEAIFDG